MGAERRQRGPALAGMLGIVGALVCAASMTLPMLGLAGAGLAVMAGMSPASGGTRTGGVGLLLTYGPALLLLSTLLFTVSIAVRRRAWALPALAAGLLMYWGMYAQPGVTLMYVATVLGLSAWAALYIWTRRVPSTVRSA